jgi:diacylglycerol kinase family enzyme
LHINQDAEKFAKLVVQGRTVRLDAGRANGRLFLLMASVGFDAEVVRRLHKERDGNISHWSYAKPILQTIRSYQYPELRITCGELTKHRDCNPGASGEIASSEEIRCRWAFVFNLPSYGGGLKFAPQSSGMDGQLDLCAFQRGGLGSGLKYLAAVVLGRHRSLRGFSGWRGTQLRIESDIAVPYELDGDPGGMLPLTIDVVPERVRLLVPTHWQALGNSPA